MTSMWFILALCFELIATAGFIVFIVKQQKWMFSVSYWLLVVGFVFHTIFLGCRYYSLGAAPVLDLKSALSSENIRVSVPTTVTAAPHWRSFCIFAAGVLSGRKIAAGTPTLAAA